MTIPTATLPERAATLQSLFPGAPAELDALLIWCPSCADSQPYYVVAAELCIHLLCCECNLGIITFHRPPTQENDP